jgi:AraC-like DNA-binding protein
MEHWSPYRDAQLGSETSRAICVAAILAGDEVPSASSKHGTVSPDADEAFAIGRFGVCSINPHLQFFDGDFETIRDLHVEMTLPASLCIGTMLRGYWTTWVDGKRLEYTSNGIPTVLAYGEPLPVINHQKAGCHIRGASLFIAAEFLADDEDGDRCPSLATLRNLLKPGAQLRELPCCSILNTILLRMRDNPYRGRMGNIYLESLALSAIVELAAHLNGESGIATPAMSAKSDLAHEAKLILDATLAAPPTAEDLARRLGTNRTTLRRLFKKTFGISILNYVTSHRLEVARVLLRQGHLQIAEIAYKMGYSDPANFTAAYKQYFGHPPKNERSKA